MLFLGDLPNHSNFKLLGVSSACRCWPPIALHCNQLECLLICVGITEQMPNKRDSISKGPRVDNQSNFSDSLMEQYAHLSTENYYAIKQFTLPLLLLH
jgi:hypothetical protein